MSKMLIIEIDGDTEELWDTMIERLRKEKIQTKEEEVAKKMFVEGLIRRTENFLGCLPEARE